MDEIPEAREIPDATLRELVRSVESDWEFEEAAPADRGFCSVYRLVVADDGESRELYLKASPDGQTWGLPTEARLQAVLHEHTSIPVPEVLAATDDHDERPTPYYLMRPLPGDEVAYERVARLDDDALGRLARETGEYLAQLHAVPAVERFGHVRHDGPALTDEPPRGDPANLTVGDPRDEWPTYLRDYAARELDRHADSGFSDLTPELERWVESRIDALDGPFDAVLGRNDHGLHNLLLDPETGLYEALAMVRIMNDFRHLDLPDGTEPAVMERIETDLRDLLGG